MKYKIFLAAILICIVLKFQSCSTGKTTSGTAIAKVPEPNEQMLSVAQKKFPEITKEALQSGHTIYTGQCTNCHGAKSVKSEPENEWVGIIDRMSIKAKLSATEKKQVLEYVLSAREYASK